MGFSMVEAVLNQSVLVVDDSALARAVVTRALGARGLKVQAFAEAKEAEAVDPRGICAALLDLEIGEASGADVARLLRKAAPAMPIAFLTAGGPAALLDAARTLGPVFSKESELDQAATWIAMAVREQRG